MANQWINVYKGNPTAGDTDGTVVSSDGLFTAPVSFTLDASVSETKVAKLAIRTETGYQTDSATTISDLNDTNDRWKFSLSSDTGWADSITITDTITTSNIIFYAKAGSVPTEAPQNDRAVKLRIKTMIAAV